MGISRHYNYDHHQIVKNLNPKELQMYSDKSSLLHQSNRKDANLGQKSTRLYELLFIEAMYPYKTTVRIKFQDVLDIYEKEPHQSICHLVT